MTDTSTPADGTAGRGGSRMLAFAITLIGYGLAVLAIGVATYLVAPPGANALTAVIVTGVIAGLSVVFAVLGLMLTRSRLAGMIGIHAGLVLPVLIAASMVPMSLRSYRATVDRYALMEAGEEVEDRHGVAYRTVAFGSITVVSVYAGIALLLHRPRSR